MQATPETVHTSRREDLITIAFGTLRDRCRDRTDRLTNSLPAVTTSDVITVEASNRTINVGLCVVQVWR